MFKALVAGALLFASNALRLETNHEEVVWSKVQDPEKMDKEQKEWDKWFRDALPALGDSQIKFVQTGLNFGAARYFDSTNNGDEEVAWQLYASGSGDKRRISRVVQTKTASEADNPNVSVITTTTFNRKNLLENSKEVYA